MEAGRSGRLLLVGSFLGAVTLGTLLLKLPAAAPAARPLSWVDALFTATSAVCVTGLVVRDTGQDLTLFGQLVVLVLIQLGGLGIMTFWGLLVLARGDPLALSQRFVLESTVGGRREALGRLLRFVAGFAFLTEAAGAVLLAVRFVPEFGWTRGLYTALFHAVSAFCNAGFSLFRPSFVTYRADPYVNTVLMALILLGGLGFLTVFELWRGRLSLQTKLVLATTALLVPAGALGIFLFEAHQAFAGWPFGEQVFASLFQSVTARTAGFQTVPMEDLTPGSLFLLMLLMFVGGAPGSCAGGVKTSTLAVLAAAAWARLRRRVHVNVWRRTLTRNTVRNAVSIVVAGAAMAVVGILALLILEGPAAPVRADRAVFLAVVFEILSALGTVGLSTGITPELSSAGKVLVVGLMLAGRLGPLTLAALVVAPGRRDDWQYPEEDVMVG